MACHLGLDSDHRIPYPFRRFLVISGKRHDPVDVFMVCFEYAPVGIVFNKIVISVAETEAGFPDMQYVHVGIGRIGADS